MPLDLRREQEKGARGNLPPQIIRISQEYWLVITEEEMKVGNFRFVLPEESPWPFAHDTVFWGKNKYDIRCLFLVHWNLAKKTTSWLTVGCGTHSSAKFCIRRNWRHIWILLSISLQGPTIWHESIIIHRYGWSYMDRFTLDESSEKEV